MKSDRLLVPLNCRHEWCLCAGAGEAAGAAQDEPAAVGMGLEGEWQNTPCMRFVNEKGTPA